MSHSFPSKYNFHIDQKHSSSKDDNDRESVASLGYPYDELNKEMMKEAESFHEQKYQIKLVEKERQFELKLKEVS